MEASIFRPFTKTSITKKEKKMKKLILLFTIVCAGQLYGMVPEYVIKAGDMASLPQEIRKFIVLTLVESSNLEEAITAIRLLAETVKNLIPWLMIQ